MKTTEVCERVVELFARPVYFFVFIQISYRVDGVDVYEIDPLLKKFLKKTFASYRGGDVLYV